LKLDTLYIEQQLIAIVHQLLEEAGEKFSQRKITLKASLQAHLGVDSLSRAELFHRIETAFRVKFPDKIIVDAVTLEDIAQALLTAIPFSNTVETKPNAKPVLSEAIYSDPTTAKSLVDLLLLYATDCPDRTHLILQDEHSKEVSITYKQLLDSSRCVASSLIAMGLEPGDTVAIMQPSNAGFFYAFMGTLLAGGVPVPIYPPLRLHLMESYAKQEAAILKNAEVKILITFREAKNIGHLLHAFVPSLSKVVTIDQLMESKELAPVFIAAPDQYALIQYTSGSTSDPKGVLLTHHNLLSNIRAYGEAIQMTSKDIAVTWLPLYHDLGLIGKWLGSLYCGAPLVVLSPVSFLNRPERWLWAIHYHRGSISAGPNFAFELCAKKIDPAAIEGLDLSSWRIAICGAEMIHPSTIERFTKRFAPYGFKPEAFLPVYGLAETSLGLTTTPLNRGPLIDRIDRTFFEEKRIAKPVNQNEKNNLEFVSCGKPLPGHEIRIVNEQDEVMQDRKVGYLQFRGPSSMQGYYRNQAATETLYHDGWWDSGDLAYQADGEIYITGRKKDVIIKAGRNLCSTEIENIVSNVPGVRQGCVIAFGVSDLQKGTEKLVIVAETKEKNTDHKKELTIKIQAELESALNITSDDIVFVPPKMIPKTSSGKLRRSVCKTYYLKGTLKKRSVPSWLQFVRIGFKWMAAKIFRLLGFIGKLIYTIYGMILFLSTVVPVWISLFLLPRRVGVRICKSWIRFLCVLGFWRMKVRGKEFLKKISPVIFVANHSSYLDSFILLTILPDQTRFVGKKEFLKVPVLKTFLDRLGYIPLDRSAHFSTEKKHIQDIKTILEHGDSIIIFPEGTFSYAEGLRPFKLGAFQLASEANIPICPVIIQGTRSILRGKEKLFKPHPVNVTILEPVTPTGTDWTDVRQLKDRVYDEVAKYCGEPILDFIVSKTSASKTRLNTL
jgi:1-acyl-sn-glycerol-3-phosphate acyltransferase